MPFLTTVIACWTLWTTHQQSRMGRARSISLLQKPPLATFHVLPRGIWANRTMRKLSRVHCHLMFALFYLSCFHLPCFQVLWGVCFKELSLHLHLHLSKSLPSSGAIGYLLPGLLLWPGPQLVPLSIRLRSQCPLSNMAVIPFHLSL